MTHKDIPADDTLTPADVAQYIPDKVAAAAAFLALVQLQQRGLIDIYLPAGWVTAQHRRFNVWISHQLRPPHGERVTLEQWCADYSAQWQRGKESDA